MSAASEGMPPHLVRSRVVHRGPGGWWAAHRAPHELRLASRLVASVVAELGDDDAGAPRRHWVASGGTWTSTGTATFLLGTPGGPPMAFLRMSPTGERRLARESDVLRELAGEPLDEGTRSVLPRRLKAGKVAGCAYVLDDLLAGVSAEPLVASDIWPDIQAQALAALGSLHHATASRRTCDDDLLRSWVDEPLSVLARVLRSLPGVTPPVRLRNLRALLVDDLRGRTVMTSWVHGDTWPGNLLIDPVSHRLTGVLDWDLAARGETPAQDYLHLLLYTRRLRNGTDIGPIVRELVQGTTSFSPAEEAVLAGAAWSFPDGMPPLPVLVLLQWLRHVAAVAIQQRSYVTHSTRAWELRNVHRVLRAL